jgi:hypothetical protein
LTANPVPNPAPSGPSTPSGSHRIALVVGLLWLYCACRGLLLVGIVPPWQGPDEPGHVEYALLLAQQRALPLQSDAALEAEILASMAAHRFYSHVNAPPPTAAPTHFAEVERLRDAPSQIGNETPFGYLPFAVAASVARGMRATGTDPGADFGADPVTAVSGADPVTAASGANPGAADPGTAITHSLRAMRLAAVILVLVTVGLAALAAVDTLGAGLAPAAVVLVAATPMLGFAGAVVNNDLTAVALATLWFAVLARGARRGLSWRWLAALVLIAALAALSKRTALFLVPLTVLVAGVYAWRQIRAARPLAPSPPALRRWIGASLAFAILVLAALLWPLGDRAAAWERAGESWGAERSSAAARSGDYGLRVADFAPDRWQYLEQWVRVDQGSAGQSLTAVAWLRAISEPGAADTDAPRAQLVLNDDSSAWAGETVTLGQAWTPVTVTLRLSEGTERVRIALVPGDGTAAGIGGLDADDIVLFSTTASGAEGAGQAGEMGTNRLHNGGAESPRHWGTDLAAGAARYTDLGRLIESVPGGLADPAASLDRTARGLAFTWRSFWGGFGWLAIWPGPVYSLAAGLLTAFAAVAAALALVAPARLADDRVTAGILRLCAVAALLCLGIAVAGSLAASGPHRLPQGRYLLPALLALALPAVALAERLWPRRGPAALAALALGLDLAALLGVIWPAFRGAP